MLTRFPSPMRDQSRSPLPLHGAPGLIGEPAATLPSARSSSLTMVTHRMSMPVATADLLRSSPPVQLNICGGRPGVALSLSLQLVDENQMPVSGAWVYVWHDDPSGWSVPADLDARTAVCFMHGVQATGVTGRVQFVMPYPLARGAASPRIYVRAYWPWGQHLVAYGHGWLLLPHDLTPEHAMPFYASDEPGAEPKPLPDFGLPVHQLDRLSLDLETAQIHAYAGVQMPTPILPTGKVGNLKTKTSSNAKTKANAKAKERKLR